jgi:hypothetical protein
MHIKSITAVAAASLMAGCAIHPEPQDVTGVSTSHIVKQIRCETRDAAREIIRKQLERLATEGNNATARDLLAQYTADPELMSGFNPNRSFPAADDVQLRNVFNLIYSAGMAYGFQLTMNEQNDLTSTANFLGPWVNKLTLGVTGSANRSRENERTFTVTDKFSFLLRELNTPNFTSTGEVRRYCDGHINLGPNYIYPIAGQIGVYKTVSTFFQMAFFDGLAPKPGATGPAASTPAMADKLTFTTVIDISATPKVVFAPVGANFQVADATGTGLLRRRDQHQVIVAVAVDPLDSVRGFVFSGAGIPETLPGQRRVNSRVSSELYVGNRVTATTRSGAEDIAVRMIDQVKSREFQLVLPPNQ